MRDGDSSSPNTTATSPNAATAAARGSSHSPNIRSLTFRITRCADKRSEKQGCFDVIGASEADYSSDAAATRDASVAAAGGGKKGLQFLTQLR